MSPFQKLVATSIFILGWNGMAQGAVPPRAIHSQQAARFQTVMVPKLKAYCVLCHTGKSAPKGVSFDLYKTWATARQAPDLWRKVRERINQKTNPMPPLGLPRPSAKDISDMTAWIDQQWPRMTKPGGSEPAKEDHLGLRRLNRAEYLNLIKDVFGDDFGVQSYLPDDAIGAGGFDNNAETLGLSASQLDGYLTAAEKIADQVVVSPEKSASSNHAGILICDPVDKAQWASCAQRIFQPLLESLYRRPVNAGELTASIKKQISRSADQNETFRDFVHRSVEGALVSPEFLLRLELGDAATGKLTPIELANRLSFFLWSREPDQTLLSSALSGKLSDPAELRAQTLRMIRDPKFDGFIENFGGYWLGYRMLPYMDLNTQLFPQFTSDIKSDMRMESKLFFKDAIFNRKTIFDLVNSNSTFLNAKLAAYYGVPGQFDNTFREVTFNDGKRGGILTQGAFLIPNSHSVDTSPVRRGKWILQNLLCTPPPPPPAGVKTTLDDGEFPNENMRQRLERHRKNPLCASCHNIMDPIGLSFENYDPSGRWRDRYANGPIDNNVIMADGTKVNGVPQLKKILAADPRYPSCFARNLLTYALGRGLDGATDADIQALLKKSARANFQIQDMLIQTVLSRQFQYR